MKPINLKPLTIALLAFAGTMMVVPLAKAQSFAPGDTDLYLEVTDTGDAGTNQSYVVDLGAASVFTSDPAGATIQLANIGSDLQTLFGGPTGEWQSSEATFQVIGANQSGATVSGADFHTVFVSAQTGSASLTTWTTDAAKKGSNTGLYGPTGTALGYYSNLATNGAGYSAGSAPGSVIVPGAGISSFGITGDASTATIGNDTDSLLPESLELFELPAGTGPTGDGKFAGTVDDLGTITLTSGGIVDFTAAGAVPEPSTYAMLAVGLGFMVWFARRRSQALGV